MRLPTILLTTLINASVAANAERANASETAWHEAHSGDCARDGLPSPAPIDVVQRTLEEGKKEAVGGAACDAPMANAIDAESEHHENANDAESEHASENASERRSAGPSPRPRTDPHLAHAGLPTSGPRCDYQARAALTTAGRWPPLLT